MGSSHNRALYKCPITLLTLLTLLTYLLTYLLSEDRRRYSTDHASFPDNRHPVFDAVDTVWYLREAVFPESLLVGVERAVVRSSQVQISPTLQSSLIPSSRAVLTCLGPWARQANGAPWGWGLRTWRCSSLYQRIRQCTVTHYTVSYAYFMRRKNSAWVVWGGGMGSGPPGPLDKPALLSMPVVPNCCCSKGPAPHWSNPFGRSGAQS